MDSEEAYNPFEAPHPDESFVPAIESPGFVVEDNRILCTEQLELPHICIATGATTNLILRSAKLRRLASVYTVGVVFTAILTFAGAIIGTSAIGRSAFTIYIQVSAVVFTAAIVVAALFGQQKVDVFWFVSRNYVRRNWLIRLTLVAVINSGLGALIWVTNSGEYNSSLTILVLTGTTVATLSYNPEKKMQLIGRKEHLYVLRGPSHHFFQQVAVSNFSEADVSTSHG